MRRYWLAMSIVWMLGTLGMAGCGRGPNQTPAASRSTDPSVRIEPLAIHTPEKIMAGWLAGTMKMGTVVRVRGLVRSRSANCLDLGDVVVCSATGFPGAEAGDTVVVVGTINGTTDSPGMLAVQLDPGDLATVIRQAPTHR